MRHVIAILVAALLVGATLALRTVAQTNAHAVAAELTSPERWLVDRRLLAAGAGAVVGAVVFNVLTAPMGVVPFAGGALEAVPSSAGLGSRLTAVTAASGGMLVATWAYDKWTGHHSDYGYILTLGQGALAGVAAGNYLALGTLGTPPYYAGAAVANAAGVMASSAAQAASRVYVVGSAALGAWFADYLYRH